MFGSIENIKVRNKLLSNQALESKLKDSLFILRMCIVYQITIEWRNIGMDTPSLWAVDQGIDCLVPNRLLSSFNLLRFITLMKQFETY